MIRSAVGFVLFLYFLGSNAMAPIRPDFFGDPLVIFHREVNRGMWQVVGPPIKATREFFVSADEQTLPLRPTIAPGQEAVEERQS